jgi:ABC-2 type transport system ATP-binding protein
MTSHLAIEVVGLRKRFGRDTALDDFDLTVDQGTVHGLLGPNGAGKTTAVRVMATLLSFDAGQVHVAGYDAKDDPERLRARISLTGQFAAVDELLSGRQNLIMFAELLQLGRTAAHRRADQLLEQFDLTDAADKSAGQYSGGMRRRLDLAASLVVTPEVLFLDEPTTGLDPRSRNQVWDAVRALACGGTTVLLTTQYLEEADQLADRISVMDGGRVVAGGTAAELKALIGGDRIEVVVRDARQLDAAAAVAGRVAGVIPDIDVDTRTVSAPVDDAMAALTGVMAGLNAGGVVAEDVGVRRPTLDEAFLQLTDHTPARTEPERKATQGCTP